VFVGFICGVLSQNSDIKEIYVDGLTNIVETVDNDSIIRLTEEFEILSKDNSVDFIISVNWDEDKLPEAIKELSI
jgi:hypothetical protein